MGKAVYFLTGLLLVCANVNNLQAQMFSVGNEGPRINTPQAEFYMVLEPMVVTYQAGDMQSPQAGTFEFDGPIIRLGYEGGGVDFFLGTGGRITGIDDASYFDAGGNIDFGLNLYRNRSFTFQIPLRISSRYTNITSDQAFQFTSFNRFRFGSLTGGAGIRALARPAENFRFKLGVVPHFGFAFASDGFFGGSLGGVAGEGKLYFDRLFNEIGLSVGYKYDLRNYDIDENLYDYRIKGHSLEVGITF